MNLEWAKIPWQNQEITKRKVIDKINFVNIKCYSLRDSINKLNVQSTDWKKVFMLHVSHRELSSEIDKKFLQFMIKTPTTFSPNR